MLGSSATKEETLKATGFKRMAMVVAICALVGAIAGIAGSAAAPSKSKATAAQKAKKQALKKRGLMQAFHGKLRGGMMHPGGPIGPVHGEAVVPNRDGTGFVTVTTDSGTLNGVDGTKVDVKEGTDKATYKDSVVIDVGGDAKVVRNGEKATLADLKAGDHVHVIQGPQGNIVFAADDAFIAQEKKEHGGFDHHGHGRLGPPPPPPPPGAPAPGGYPGDDAPGSGDNS